MLETPILPRRIPTRLEVGARSSFSRTLTEADVALFIGVTWDINPLHTDETYARATRFKRLIVPGLLTASLATHLGGLWAFMATEMRFEFLAPVYVGDTITTTAEVSELNPENGFVRLKIRCTNAEEKEVLRGEAGGFPGRHEE